jgi:tRNA nucleotidyltransferase (CCA-adding enzyme)
MSTLHVSHSDIVRFADERVNLKREDAKEYRDQVNWLRERLDGHIRENPDFALKKMLLSGSLAKGTALKTINDADVAVYVSAREAPADMGDFINWLAGQIRAAVPNLRPEQVKANPFTVTVSFSGTGLKVDVVPVLYNGDSNWKGHLVSKNDGTKVLTSIPMHLDFIRRRKAENETHYAQVIRLLKHWVRYVHSMNTDFRFKSFMIELYVAYLADRGLKLDDYPEALAQIFAHIATDAFKTDIVFGDHYHPSKCADCNDPIRIWDPVNHQNNAASRYTEQQRDAIIKAALEAGDAIDAALYATTKTDTLRHWRRVFGPAFDA